MLTTSIFTLILSIFANRVLCDTKFLRPPEWNSDVDGKAGSGMNTQYTVGHTIQLLWETDLDKVQLYLFQRTGSITGHKVLDSSRTEWKAEWDVMGTMENNEDTVYFFILSSHSGSTGGSIAMTQEFNVTAPKLETTTATMLQTSTTIQSISSVATSATQPLPTSTTTDRSSDPDTHPNYDSGISKSEIAGAAVGGTIGGLIILGVVGWLIWRKLGRSKKETGLSVVSQGHHQQFQSSETKAELPGEPAVEGYPSGYARSPPGLHEAP
ncbi:hypothetical protein FANTH_1395 [Fusarium anthophilum]|uniref:Mid2 domain-containing protein n=1 Tax=Fusarium anthophilum TaxID=48485 RepID=A0A8H4ZVS8_9HYPO|nr:hypothetical protein FANTH_1395 [Fusarium anthophilum]